MIRRYWVKTTQAVVFGICVLLVLGAFPVDVKTIIEDYMGLYRANRAGAAYNGTTLQAAITAIGSYPRTLYLSANPIETTETIWNIASNITVPDNIILKIPKGVKLRPASGITVTIAARPIIGEYFALDADENTTGAIRFGSGSISSIPAVWFGTICDGVTDVGHRLKAALASLPSVSVDLQGGKVILPTGNCVSSVAQVPTKPFHLIGQGAAHGSGGANAQTTYTYTGSGDMFTVTGAAMSNSIFEDFNVDHTGTATNGFVIDSSAARVQMLGMSMATPQVPFSANGVILGKTGNVHSFSMHRSIIRKSAPIGLYCNEVSSTALIFDSTIQHHTTGNLQLGAIAGNNCKEFRSYNSRYENHQAGGGHSIIGYRTQYAYFNGGHCEIADQGGTNRACVYISEEATSNNYMVFDHVRFVVISDSTTRPIFIDNDAQLFECHNCIFEGADTAGTGGYVFNMNRKHIKLHHSYRAHSSAVPIVATFASSGVASSIVGVDEKWTVSQGGAIENGFIPERLCQSYALIATPAEGPTDPLVIATCTLPADTVWPTDGSGFAFTAFGEFADTAGSKVLTVTISDATLINTGNIGSDAGGLDSWILTCHVGRSANTGMQSLCTIEVWDKTTSTTAPVYKTTQVAGSVISPAWAAAIDVVITSIGAAENDIRKRGFYLDINRR